MEILGFFKESFFEIIWCIEFKFLEITEIVMVFQYSEMLLASSDEPMLMRQKMSTRIHLYSRTPVPRTLRRETKNS